ncbi:MOSC domain-containing protein [Pontixanthobacter sp.]|uniref:MOSC domain-containing protein n=1 Tax=Pontixanthobacter sp. TaxID=2792078 RepID=UPI003C79E11E
MRWPIKQLLIGSAEKFRGEETSAIRKRPAPGPLHITVQGLAGDEQADRTNHGGPHMAVHHYPQDHSAFWQGIIGDHSLLRDAGAFGTNLVISGLTETDIYIGERFRLGGALLEVSQPRKPCWKIEHNFAQKGMVTAILKSGKCGWYYRVIEEGRVAAADALVRAGTPHSHWSVARAFAVLWGDPRAASQTDIRDLAATEALTPKLRDALRARIT